MSTSATHILRKLDKVRERTAQYRSDRIINIKLNRKTSYKKAVFKKSYSSKQIENFKIQYRKKIEKRHLINNLIIGVLVILGLPAALWLAHTVLMYGFNS